MEKKKEMTNEDLATLIQGEFLSMHERMGNMETDIKELKTDVARLDKKVDAIEANLNKKVDKVDHNTLVYRVEKLEKKFA